MRTNFFSLLSVLIEVRCPKMAPSREKNSEWEFLHLLLDLSPVRFVAQRSLITGNFCPIRKIRASAFAEEGRGILAYNLLILRKPAGIFLSLPFLARSVLEAQREAQQQGSPPRLSRLLLIIPFENWSKRAGTAPLR